MHMLVIEVLLLFHRLSFLSLCWWTDKTWYSNANSNLDSKSNSNYKSISLSIYICTCTCTYTCIHLGQSIAIGNIYGGSQLPLNDGSGNAADAIPTRAERYCSVLYVTARCYLCLLLSSVMYFTARCYLCLLHCSVIFCNVQLFCCMYCFMLLN